MLIKRSSTIAIIATILSMTILSVFATRPLEPSLYVHLDENAASNGSYAYSVHNAYHGDHLYPYWQLTVDQNIKNTWEVGINSAEIAEFQGAVDTMRFAQDHIVQTLVRAAVWALVAVIFSFVLVGSTIGVLFVGILILVAVNLLWQTWQQALIIYNGKDRCNRAFAKIVIVPEPY